MIDYLRARWWILRHPFKAAAIRRFLDEHYYDSDE